MSSSDDSDDSIKVIPVRQSYSSKKQQMEDVSSSSSSSSELEIKTTQRTRRGNKNVSLAPQPPGQPRTRTRTRNPMSRTHEVFKLEPDQSQSLIVPPPKESKGTEDIPDKRDVEDEPPKKSKRHYIAAEEEEIKETVIDDKKKDIPKKSVVVKPDADNNESSSSYEYYEEEEDEEDEAEKVKRRKKKNQQHNDNHDIIQGTVDFQVQSPDEQVSVPVPPPPPIQEVRYALTRKNKISIKGSSYVFHLMQQEEIILSSKCKSRNPSKPMPITRGENVHLSTGGEFYLVPDKGATIFELRKGSVNGPKIMGSHIMHNIHNLMMPRTVVVDITEESGIPMLTLVTKKPKMNRNGTFTLHFQNRFTIPSEKNAIFLNQALGLNGPDVLSIRKIGKEMLEIIADSTLPDYVVFSIGLTMFTGNLSC